MDQMNLTELLSAVAAGKLSVDAAHEELSRAPFVDLGYAKPDFSRRLRQGVSEVIYGAGKTVEQIVGIATALTTEGGSEHVLITRLDTEKAREVEEALETAITLPFSYHAEARIGILGSKPEPNGVNYVVIAAAGTSDLYCAEEAALTAEMMGSRVIRCYDVGVAGIHRLLAHVEDLSRASAVVAVAGMEGALASVVGGLVPCPVIACPTSVGYGASFGGIAALLSMLNSCASGVSVVNIDNGFGAGFQAALIDHVGVAAQD